MLIDQIIFETGPPLKIFSPFFNSSHFIPQHKIGLPTSNSFILPWIHIEIWVVPSIFIFLHPIAPARKISVHSLQSSI